MRNKPYLLLITSIVGVTFACQASAKPAQTLQPFPPAPTVTPRPSSTSTSIPSPTPSPSPTLEPSPTPEVGVVLAGAGDIVMCDYLEDSMATARLLESIPGTIFTAGDNSNDGGFAEQYEQCYQSTWGQFKDRIRPAPGNHDYAYTGGEPYLQYFGEAAGTDGTGYYSYELGSWHVIALNSNCGLVGGCGFGSPMESWLLADLAAHPAVCTLAYWHHPRFNSGLHGSQEFMTPIWQDLYMAGVEFVVNGHNHHYERFAPQSPEGTLDINNGIRQFIAGTGGAPLYPLAAVPIANSEIQIDTAHGIIKFTLYSDRYEWQFISVDNVILDSGIDYCH